MPTHEFRCNNCQEVTEVVRTLKGEDYKRTPSKEEQKCDCKLSKFIKILSRAPEESYGENWGNGKGNW